MRYVPGQTNRTEGVKARPGRKADSLAANCEPVV
jgi:hypothetical protein